jgi:hypothetical protein
LSCLQVGPGIFELPYKLGTKFLYNDYWIVAVGELQQQQHRTICHAAYALQLLRGVATLLRTANVYQAAVSPRHIGWLRAIADAASDGCMYLHAFSHPPCSVLVAVSCNSASL